MRTYYAGPSGSAGPGGALTVSDEEGAALIAGNYAEAVPEPETATAPAPEVAIEVVETATVAPAETTEAPHAKKPRIRRGR